jgi:trigger factor
LKVTTEDLGDRQVLLTIEVDEERIEKALRSTARRVSKQYSIPGFRRGRAPYHVILRRFGREALLKDALDDLGQDVIQDAMEGEDLELYGPGHLEDMQLDPLIFKVRVPLKPSVDLGDYRELRVEPPPVSVDEKDIEAELERLRQDNVVLEPGGDRSAQMGDMVTLDVKADVEEKAYLDHEDHNVVLDAGDDSFAPGFSEQIVGMAAGEEKTFTLTLPDGEESDADVAGKEALFAVTLHDVRGRILPDLDDDLARTVGDFDTLEELRQDIRSRFEESEQRQADQAYTEEVLEALVASADIQYPPDMVEDQIDNNIKGIERQFESQGLSTDDFFKLSGQTEEAFRESLRPRAERSIRRGLVLGELARRENLDVEDEEIHGRIALMSASWGERAAEAHQMLSTPEAVRSVSSDLLADKAVQRLVAIAKGQAPPLEDAAAKEGEEPAEDSQQVPDEVAPVAVETELAEPVLDKAEHDQVHTPEIEQTEV